MNNFFATSPQRHSFQRDFQKRQFEKNQITKETFEKLETMWMAEKQRDAVMSDEISLENDLRSSKEIAYKCQNSKEYSQNLYAALCNNEFIKNEAKWSCSWRHAGGIVANLNQNGDYINWYSSGIEAKMPFVSEGTITEQIKKDIESFGWEIIENKLD